MRSRFRVAASSLIGISIAISVLLVYPDANRSRATAHASGSKALLEMRTAGIDEEMKTTTTFKPTAGGTKSWKWQNWWGNGGQVNCALSSLVSKTALESLEFGTLASKVPGEITAGFVHQWDGGSGPFPCQGRITDEFVGTVWFDLGEIYSKPPLPKADNATLTFRAIASDGPAGVCKDELRLPSDDWMKGLYNENGAPGPGGSHFRGTLPKTGSLEPAVYFEGCPSEGCSFNVTSIVNNWIKGTEDRYGFAISGLDDLAAIGTDDGKNPDNNAHCTTRYGDFRLTVTYTFATKKALVTPQTYPLVCRGTETLNVHDLAGSAPYRWVGFAFIPGSKPAGEGLLPGQCSWKDRGLRPGEPARLAQPIEGALAWIKDLNSSNSYWTFEVYNAGDQMQATAAERNKRLFLPPLRTNVALATNGATVRAQDFTADGVVPGLHFQPAYAIDGIRHTTATGGNYWRDEHGLPSWLEVDFPGLKTIEEIDVVTIQVPGYDTAADPTDKQTFTDQGASEFEVQYWTGSKWERVELVTGNNLVVRKIVLPGKIKTSMIRVYVNKSSDGVARIVELETWGV